MKSALYIFILISALIHFVILSAQNEPIYIIADNHEQGGSFLNIELSPKKTEANTHLKNKVTGTHITKKKKAKAANKILTKKTVDTSIIKTTGTPSLADIAPEQKAPVPVASSIKQKIEIDRSYSHSVINSDKNEKIKTLLNNELAKHFYYPKSAQRKNRQGHVILAFTINRDGSINNIHINKSSGYNVLDKAAIRALNKIDANKDLARALNGQSTEHFLPVTYKLVSR